MKKILYTLAFIAAMVSCSKEKPNGPSTGPKAVDFKIANISFYTLKSTAVIGSAESSKVGIYASELGANNVQATVSGSSLTPATAIYWKEGQTEATLFIARYPYAESSTIDGEYTIPSDQSNEENYFYQENMMTAVASASPNPGTVAFDFTHPFAKVAINITNNLAADAVASVVLKNVKQTATKLDLTTAPAIATLDGSLSEVTAYRNAANAYSLILMPQTANEEMDIRVTTTLGSVYSFRLDTPYSFEAGKIAETNLTLNPIDGPGSSLTAVGAMSFTSREWVPGSPATTSPIGQPEIGAYFQIGGTIYTDEDTSAPAWSKWFNMVLTAADTWTATINYDESRTSEESSKGLLIRIADNADYTYYKMFNASENIGTGEYELYVADEDHSRNIRLPEVSGKYLITFNSATHKISATLQ